MRYVEFIAMLGKLAHELYTGTKQEDLELYIKVDAILEPLLASCGAK